MNIILNKKYKKGFGMVGIMLSLVIVGAITSGMFVWYKDRQIQIKGELAGEQIRLLGQAVDEYISINYDKIANLESDQNLKCKNAGFCQITVEGLKKSGELPNTFLNLNSWGSEYKIELKREGISPNYKITGIVVTKDAPTTKPVKILGNAVKNGGANAGNNLINIKKISGNSGAWYYTKSDFDIISDSEYQLAYRVGYNASQYSPYLRRDGTLPMTGNLDLSGHNINNIGILRSNQVATDFMRSNNVNVERDLSVNGTLNGNLVPKQTVIPGQPCSPIGLVAKNETGALVSCVNGYWANISSNNGEVYLFRVHSGMATYSYHKNYIDKYTMKSETVLKVGTNLNGDCLYSSLQNRQCGCGVGKVGMILAITQDSYLVSCDTLDNKYIAACDKVEIKRNQNHYAISNQGGNVKQRCRQQVQSVTQQKNSILGLISIAPPEKKKNSSSGDGGGGHSESGPGGSRK